jgi:predicted nucleic acid-binding protein
VKAFFDTNILVYAFSTDPRRDRAAEVIALGGDINAQVLNEFTNVLHKKQKLQWPVIEDAKTSVHRLFPNVRPLTVHVHENAIVLARKHTLSFYDALIISAALEAECDVLFSEDLQHGRKFGELEVVNPFK